MNTKMITKISIALMILTFVLSVSSVMAGESKAEFISGTIVQTSHGYALSTNTGEEYMVKGKDVSDMVGQQVAASGTVQEDASGKSIQISSITVTSAND